MLYDEMPKYEVREIQEVDRDEANKLLVDGWNYLGYKVNTEFKHMPIINEVNPETVTSFTYIVGRMSLTGK